MANYYIPINVKKISIDWAAVHAALDNSPSVRAVSKEVSISAVEERVREGKTNLIRRFNSHPVTEELNESKTSSELLGSGSYGGNLFSYVGFHEGSNPADEIRQYLTHAIQVDRAGVRKTQRKLSWRIPVIVPDMDDFNVAKVAEIPWMAGMSTFVYHIEKGIPGVARYMYSKSKKKGRSGKAIQVSSDIGSSLSSRGSLRQPQSEYMTGLLAQFSAEVST